MRRLVFLLGFAIAVVFLFFVQNTEAIQLVSESRPCKIRIISYQGSKEAVSQKGAKMAFHGSINIVNTTEAIEEKIIKHLTGFSKKRPTKYSVNSVHLSRRMILGKYGEYIKKASLMYGVSEKLIVAVIKTESDGDPECRSHKGAIGLMQLMPETAKDMGVGNPYCPGDNILGGTRYLAKCIEQMEKYAISQYISQKYVVAYALGCYNMGIKRMTDNILVGNTYHVIPETSRYVSKVFKYLS